MSDMLRRIYGLVIANVHITATVVAMAILFYTGFANDNSLVDGNQVAKREFFALAGIVVAAAALINVAKSRLKVNIIDFLVVAFVILAIATFFINEAITHTKLLLLVLIFALYVNLRVLFSADKRAVIITIVLILTTGIAQSVIGLMQLFGNGFSNHYLYKITGTFFNPGPYGGYLAVIASVAAAIVFGLYNRVNNKPLQFNASFFAFGFALVAYFASFLLLPASMSRTAWVAFGFCCLVIFLGKVDIRRYIRRYKVAFSLAMVVFVSLAIGAYILKKESADGRLVTWLTGVEATFEKPLTGTAVGHFAESFTQAQSRIFADFPHYAYFAGSPEYGFNEFIQITIEYGYLGLLIFCVIVFLVLKNLLHADVLVKSLGIGMIALLAFAFASYPFSLLPFLIVLVVMLAAGASIDGLRGIQVGVLAKLVVVCSVGGITLYGFAKTDSVPYREWYWVQALYQNKEYDAAIDGYDSLYEKLSDNHKFLFEYGHALGFTDRHIEAIEVLRRGTRISCDPMFYNIIGNSYKAIGEIELAAHNYIYAHDIIPSRVYPLYLLVKLYNDNNQRDETTLYAQKVLNHKDKIPSPATREIRDEVREIYNKLSGNNDTLCICNFTKKQQ